MPKTKILFVCLGNICRSPMAEGVFRHIAGEAGALERLEIDSAATGAWHTGDPPDARAQAAAKSRGIDISMQRARSIERDDFETFDLILAMDNMNHGDLKEMAPPGHDHKVRLFLSFAPALGVEEVPDPYYGGPEGFDHVLDLVDEAGRALLAAVETEKEPG